MKCKNCGHDNEDSKFCSECGKGMSDDIQDNKQSEKNSKSLVQPPNKPSNNGKKDGEEPKGISPILIYVLIGIWPLAMVFPPALIATIFGIILAVKQYKQMEKFKQYIPNAKAEAANIIKNANTEASIIKNDTEEYVNMRRSLVNNDVFNELETKIKASEKKLATQQKKLENIIYSLNAANAAIEKFNWHNPSKDEMATLNNYLSEVNCEDMLSPTAEIKLHNTDIKDLNKQYKAISAKIESTLAEYEKRYSTKGNLALYRLMVLALKAELQNVLYILKYNKLDDSIILINKLCDKYLVIAEEANQQIASTMAKFIGAIESLFVDAVKVEYEYYVRKERIKEEQRILREQMKLEAEERKLLEQQQKQIEKEESKYITEIDKLREQLAESEAEKVTQIEERIAELQQQLVSVEEKKEAILNLQNGKAGYVYIISNLGAFGETVFKIGMTRRLEPQQRIDELGNASVPFRFDVHSFIFSQDASTLETSIHKRLNDRRVNKVNFRKEFFKTSIDELESLVYELEPSAEFSRTMIAEEYKQSLSTTEPLGEAIEEDDDELDEEIA